MVMIMHMTFIHFIQDFLLNFTVKWIGSNKA